jgi:5-formyltetrahydrofolate cyclo-ligase
MRRSRHGSSRELDALLAPLPPQVLAFCAPVRNEFDARPLAARLIERGWSHCHAGRRNRRGGADAFPRAGRLRRRDDAATATASRSRPRTIEIVPTIVLLPLVAFDPRGFRLGYGGGYFDRTLAVHGSAPAGDRRRLRAGT